MRPIDADALKELFSEVIGSIAKKPEMNGNLEHMIRASAMVIQMIDDAPTVDTTTHDSIPAETGKNDGDRTSGDCISRQAAINAVKKALSEYDGDYDCRSRYGVIVDSIENIKNLPPIQPEIIRCKDCEWWTKQKDSIQGRCALHKMYPSGNWYCGTARRRGEQDG